MNTTKDFKDKEQPQRKPTREEIRRIEWRVFCKHKNLKTEGYPAIREYCKGVIEQYKAEKKAGSEVVEETMMGEKVVQE